MPILGFFLFQWVGIIVGFFLDVIAYLIAPFVEKHVIERDHIK